MTPDARRNALAIIAREHVLTRRELLDTMGRPERLRDSEHPDVERLSSVGRSILERLPDDLSTRFPEFSEGEDGMVATFDGESGVLLALKELVAADGSTWLSAVCATVYHGAGDAVGGLVESVNVLVNRLNMNDAGAAWATTLMGEERSIVRLTGTAHPLDEGAHSWFDLVAYLLATSIAASERGGEGVGPGTSYVELLSLDDDIERFTLDDVESAAIAFRRSFPEELARVVLLERIEDGVGVSIPFRADGDVQALTALFTVPSDKSSGERGLRVFSNFYEAMSTKDAYRWARAFNGDDEVPESEDVWDQTTPWLLGAWQTMEVEADDSAVYYKGFVPDVLKRHASTEEIIRGVLKEIWMTSNRYRLRKEFEETIRSSHGDS